MAKKAKEILIANGFTEEELAAPEMAVLMGNAKWCKALELESERAETEAAEKSRLQGELDSDLKWYQEQAAPALKKATDEALSAKGEAAKYRAQLEAAQEMGLLKIAGQEGANGMKSAGTDTNSPGSTTGAIQDPATGQFISRDSLGNELAPYLNQVGDVVAMAADIPLDHRDLFGAPLPGGMAGLRKEYNDARTANRFRGSLMEYWENKYKVADKRAEVSAATRQKEMDEYADAKLKEERAKWISENSNPMTRPPVSSRSPFTNRSAVITGASAAGANGTTGASGAQESKQPWEKGSPEQRAQSRITGFVQKSMEKVH